MNHAAELSDASRTLHDKIVSILAANNLPSGPGDIVRSACETVMKLCARGSVGKIGDVLGIIAAYREHIVYSDLFLSVVESAIDRHTGTVLSMVKSCLRNSGGVDTSRVLNLLLDKKELAGVAHVIARYFPGADVGRAGQAAVQTPGDGGVEQFVGRLDLMMAANGRTNEFVLSYIRSASDLSSDVLVKIVDSLERENKSNFEILSLVYGFNRRNTNAQRLSKSAGDAGSIISPRLVELTCHEVLEAGHSDHELEAFVSLFPDLLLPSFIPLIEEVNAVFLREGRLVGLLRNIIRYIKIEVFMEIAGPVQIEKHCNVFKGISNCDLEVFVGLYDSCNTEERRGLLGHVLVCLPHFCNYCTDYGHNIGRVVSLIRDFVQTHRSLACSALEKMVHSHTLNLGGGLVLDNPIEKAESVRILECIRASGIVQAVVQAFIHSNNNECDRALELLIALTGLDLSGELAQVVLRPEEGRGVGLHDALRLMAFFADRWEYSYDVICELLRLTTSGENNVQKRAYFLLYKICSAQAVPCFCDLLFTSTTAGMHASSTRNRMMLLYALAKRGCAGCKCEDMREKFFLELVRYSKGGNAKARRFATETIVELAENPGLRAFVLSHIDRAVDDQELVGGCLEVAFIILEHIGCNEEYRLRGDAATSVEFVDALFGKVRHISFSSEQLVRPILKLFALMFSLPGCAMLADDISFILGKYIPRFSKRLNRELRECTLAAQKNGHKMNKQMVLLLKFKNRSGRPKEIQVLKSRAD